MPWGTGRSKGSKGSSTRGCRPSFLPTPTSAKAHAPAAAGGIYDFMRRVLDTDHGTALYKKRQAFVEPVFAQTKWNRTAGRFQRRGRAAAQSEWRLLPATHNLLKLHKHRLATA
jgi:Transposase DDE domain